MITCEFCKKEYSTIPILKHHQKTAVFCIKLQNEENNKIIKYKY